MVGVAVVLAATAREAMARWAACMHASQPPQPCMLAAPQACARKARIMDVVYNASNNELVRGRGCAAGCMGAWPATTSWATALNAAPPPVPPAGPHADTGEERHHPD